MVRSKFLVFALLVLALWLGHLLLLPEAFAPRATDQAALHARTAASVLAAKAGTRRAEVAGVAAAMASAPGLPAILKAPDRLPQLVALAQQSAPPAFRGQLVVGLMATEASAQFAAAEGVAVNRAGLDPSLGKAGLAGVIQDVAGVPHAFTAFAPVFEGRPLRLVVGAPLYEAATLEAARTEAGVAALALLKGGVVVAESGEKGLAARGAKAVAAGKAGVIERGSAGDLYGISLPLRGTPLRVGARQPFEGSPYEVLAVSSTQSFAGALASYQRLALGVAVALLLVSLVFLLLIGRGVRADDGDDSREEAGGEAFVPGGSPLFAHAREAAAAAPAPRPAANDAPPGAPVPPRRAAATPAAIVPPPPPPVPDDSPFGAPGSHGGALPDDAERTPPADNADATRVAMIPQELLDASARTHLPEAPARPGGRAVAPPPVAQLNDEEQHFQEVYREFVATRERCGEGADGVTYDRFVQKLRKNKEQLVQKYGCRTVRFQVYVKEGKAALKATPVKG